MSQKRDELLKAVGYIRVSTSEQADSGLGIEAQLAEIARHCKAQDIELIKVCRDEAISGGDPVEKRPGLMEAIASVPNGGRLIVAKRDRLVRDVMLAGWIELKLNEKHARIVSCAGEGGDSDDPSSRLMRTIIDAFAEYERMQIKWRTKVALQAKKKRGEALGNTPFGFQRGDDGSLQRDQSEFGTLKVLIELAYTSDFKDSSYRQIARTLNERGLRARRRGWTADVVRRCAEGDGGVFREYCGQLRKSGLGDRQIAERLNDEGVLKPPAAVWRHGQVARILKFHQDDPAFLPTWDEEPSDGVDSARD